MIYKTIMALIEKVKEWSLWEHIVALTGLGDG